MRRTTNLVLSLMTVAVLTACSVAVGATQEGETVLDEDFAAPSGLEIRVHDADIVIRTGTTDRLAVRVVMIADDIEAGRARMERMNFRATADGGTVIVRSDQDRNDSWNWRRQGNFHVRVEISAPEHIDLTASTEDGDIRAERLVGDIRLLSEDGDIVLEGAEGPLEIETADGDIRVGTAAGPRVSAVTQDGDVTFDVVTTDSLVIESSDGDLAVDVADAADVDARTSDGNIALRGVRGDVRARTSDGDVRIEIDAAGEIELDTHDGDIAVSLPDDASVRLELRGENTSMRATGGFDGTVDRRRVSGRLNGGGPTIKADSHGGRVSVRLREGTR